MNQSRTPGKQIRLKFWLYDHLGPASVLLLLLSAVALRFMSDSSWQTRATVVGSVLGFVYFAQKQRLDETRFFIELFGKFNERYDDLHGNLMGCVLTHGATKEPAQDAVIFEYFNLCAEEFMMMKRGYIHPDAWWAWKKGMDEIFQRPAVRDLWTSEEPGSYYGLEALFPHHF